MSTPAFRGTLLLLQNRTRRDPESYRDEFLAQLDHFKASSATVAAQKVANPQYIAVLNYVCHVCHCFPKEAPAVASVVLELLRAAKGSSLPADLRAALVKAMMLLRAKDIVSIDDTFPLLFDLLQERDKSMRRLILSHIVSDVRKVNMPGAKGGPATNRKAQNFLFAVMAEDDPVQARCAEMVLIDLYRRRVWCDERSVEVLTRACFSRHTAILRTALRFFLMQMPKITSVDDEDSDEEEVDPGRSISKIKQKQKIVKKTGKRERILKREMRSVKRRYNKEETQEQLFAKQHVDPIRLLRDPQQFVERLLARLHRTAERFEVRLLYLNVIARAVSEHEVVHLPLYSFIERYMEPSQLHATQLLALSSMCVHRMVPPDAVEPLLKTIANHFVSDRSTPDAITVGINTIREMCKRQPLAMNEDLLKDLCEYRSQRGDKGVMMAARALIQLYREVYPALLPAKMRGSKAGAADVTQKPVFGATEVYTDIPGLELLFANSGSSSSDDSDDDDSSSGEWETDSDPDLDPEDIDGDFVDVSNSEEDEEAESDGDDDDGVPQLVPAVKADKENSDSDSDEPPAKMARAESDGSRSLVLSSDNESSSGEEDEEEASGSGSDDDGEWEFASMGSEEVEDEDAEEDGDEDEEEEEEKGKGKPSLAQAIAATSKSGWFEDTDPNSRATSVPSSTTSSTASSVATSRILTSEDFEKLRKLQEQGGSHRSLRGRDKARAETSKRRHELIHGISNDLSAHDIESFTTRKRERDRDAKIEKAQEMRKAKSTFEARKKTKSKLNSTHKEHSKRGKLFQMTKRSQRVAAKLKSSVVDRSERKKEMKKKDIRFRIMRGWKA